MYNIFILVGNIGLAYPWFERAASSSKRPKYLHAESILKLLPNFVFSSYSFYVNSSCKSLKHFFANHVRLHDIHLNISFSSQTLLLSIFVKIYFPQRQTCLPDFSLAARWPCWIILQLTNWFMKLSNFFVCFGLGVKYW